MMPHRVSLVRLSAILLTVCAPLGIVSDRSCFGAPPASSGASASVSNPLVRLAPADSQTLAAALRSVSNQTGLAFVAEGTPFRERGSAPPLVALVEKWPANGVSLSDAVQKIAGAYDYDAERKGDVFLLRKRYTNPNDLPEVTTEELRLALRDIVRASSGLPAPVADMPSFENKNSPFTAKFYETLTPDQIKTFTENDGYGTIKVRDMNSTQKRMMQDLAFSRHIQKAVGEAQKAQFAVRECDQKTTVFGWTDMTATDDKRTQTVRVLCCMVRENGNAALIPFAPDGRMQFRFDNRRIGYREAGDNQDAAKPTEADYGPNHEPLLPEEIGPDTFTLQALGERLHEKVAEAQVGIVPLSFGVHEALVAKSVTVVGKLGINAEAIWRAAGAVYGLSVVRTEEGGPLRMQRPRPQIARDLASLNKAAFAAFPAPLIRLYRGAYNTEEGQRLKRPRPSYLQPQEGESVTLKANRDWQWKEQTGVMAKFNTPARLKRAVLHRFRVLAEPRIAQTSDKRVLYSDLNDKAHDLWTLALFVDCLGNASDLDKQALPLTITAFDTGYLSAHLNDGFGTSEPKLQFTFWSRTDKNGYSHVDGGSVFPVPDTFPVPIKPKR